MQEQGNKTSYTNSRIPAFNSYLNGHSKILEISDSIEHQNSMDDEVTIVGEVHNERKDDVLRL